ncbi:MAG TPA: alkaline phosphatase family protein [Gaiellaceae bacterium]|nr:alkaline phosphatase family protein [Gaiellaceae bacterium]
MVWIWMENKPFGAVIGSAAAPFENELAAACGLATGYRGIAHPSLPNYVAATSGSTQGIADDGPPAAHPLEVASIYSQLRAAGRSWRDYEEGAPGPCPLASGGAYAVRHDPAPYYSGIRADCALWDVPMGTTAGGSFLADLDAGTLPAFAFVTPDLCHGTHDCPVATGDAWLQAWFAKILASPAYQAGDTVVFLTWDEDDGSAANHVPLIVVSPSTVPGTRSPLPADHYALLKTTEQLLGLTPLGHAADPATPTLTTTFNLG